MHSGRRLESDGAFREEETSGGDEARARPDGAARDREAVLASGTASAVDPGARLASTVSGVSQPNVELVLRGYWAFVAGDLDTVAEMLDPDIEWISIEPEAAADREDMVAILGERFEEGYRVELERCVGVGDDVAVSFRVAGEERDATDDRPLQTRRYFTVGRYSAVVTVRNGRVRRVQEYPHLAAALEALGLDEET